MNNIKPYKKYKASGIEWLGDIPEHWKIPRLRFLCKITTGSKNTEDKKVDGLYNFYVRSQKVERIDSYSFEGEGILTAGDGVGVGKVFHYVNEKFDFHQRVYLFFHFRQNISPKFLFYYLKRNLVIDLKLYNAKSTVDSVRLPTLQNFPINLPSLPEQTAIATFLDYKTAKIDRFIRKKKQLIKLLNEQKAGIINEAVTKGIGALSGAETPKTKMKPSGIEWLGEIPEHWEVRKLKYVAECFPSNIDKHTREGEKQIRLCNYTDVYKNDFITNDMTLMVASATDEQIEKFSLQIGDVIITKDSETANDIAVPAVVKEELLNVVCGYHLSVFRPHPNLLGEYLFRVLQCKAINVQFEVYSNGVTRVGLGVYDTKKAQIPVPPIQEQTAIVSHIQKETGTLNTTIATIEKEIALVQEYRTALIAEAVTGKINVLNYDLGDGYEDYDLKNDDEIEENHSELQNQPNLV